MSFRPWPKNRSRNKFGAVASGGFPSKLEEAVYHLLRVREGAREIKDIKRQQSVVLQGGPRETRITYRVDFSYYEIATKQTVWVEAKGFQNDVWKMKIKLWRIHGPGRLEIYGGHHKRPGLKEVIEPTGTL